MYLPTGVMSKMDDVHRSNISWLRAGTFAIVAEVVTPFLEFSSRSAPLRYHPAVFPELFIFTVPWANAQLRDERASL